VYNHCNICNIPIYFCNIHMKHLQYTYETSETLETCVLQHRGGWGRSIPVIAVGAGGKRQRASTIKTSTSGGVRAPPPPAPGLVWPGARRQGHAAHDGKERAAPQRAERAPLTPALATAREHHHHHYQRHRHRPWLGRVGGVNNGRERAARVMGWNEWHGDSAAATRQRSARRPNWTDARILSLW
jgi:hypothetical protein